MAVVSIYRLAEECARLIESDPSVAGVSYNELKIAIGQVVNGLLKTEYFSVNAAMGEAIPNGATIATYEGLVVTKHSYNKAECTLPIKPIKLPRNMGVFSVYDSNGNEFIPMQMGQSFLAKGQRLLNDCAGQCAYENFGMKIVFHKDITNEPNDVTVNVRLVIMDVNSYNDYEPLPITPEMEWQVKKEIWSMYSQTPVPDKLVDSTTKDQVGNPIKAQSQN
jgi:hypothetical protein